jgi:hypothetical protein
LVTILPKKYLKEHLMRSLFLLIPFLFLILTGCDNRERYAEDIRERGGDVREGGEAPPVVNVRLTDNNMEIPGKVRSGDVVFNISNRAKDTYRFFIEGNNVTGGTELNIRSGYEGRMSPITLSPGKYQAVAVGNNNEEIRKEFEVSE